MARECPAAIKHIAYAIKVFFSLAIHSPIVRKRNSELNCVQIVRKYITKMLDHVAFHLLVLILLLCDVSVVVSAIIVSYEKRLSPENETLHHLHRALEITSIWYDFGHAHNNCSILSIFLVESVLRMIAFGVYFLVNFWFLLDFAIILSSLLLEILVGEEYGLLVLTRIWIILRIVITVTISIQEGVEAATTRHEIAMEKTKKDLEERVLFLKEQIADFLSHVEKLVPLENAQFKEKVQHMHELVDVHCTGVMQGFMEAHQSMQVLKEEQKKSK